MDESKKKGIAVFVCFILCLVVISISGLLYLKTTTSIPRSEEDIRNNIELERKEEDGVFTLVSIDVKKVDGQIVYTYNFSDNWLNGASYKTEQEIQDVSEGDCFSYKSVYYDVNYYDIADEYIESSSRISSFEGYTEIPYLGIVIEYNSEEVVKSKFDEMVDGYVESYINSEDRFIRKVIYV